jgi:hypothetical protein
LLREWGDNLGGCERIWMRASWSNRRMFMQENGGIFEKGKSFSSYGYHSYMTQCPHVKAMNDCVLSLSRLVDQYVNISPNEQSSILTFPKDPV